jgi:hypothetical protein
MTHTSYDYLLPHARGGIKPTGGMQYFISRQFVGLYAIKANSWPKPIFTGVQ